MKTKIFTVFLFSISVFVFSQHKFLKYPEFNKNELSKTKSTIKEDAHGNCRKPRHAQRQCHVPPICGACGLLQDGISIHRPGEYPSDAIRKIRPAETQTALRRSLYLLLLSERCVQSREISDGIPENPSEKQQGQSAGSRCGRSSHHRRRQPIQCRRKLAEGHQRKAQERGLLQWTGRYRQRNPHQIVQ